MNLSGSFGKIYKEGCFQSCEPSVDSIEKVVNRDIIRMLDSLSLEHSPKSLGYVEMRGIRRQKEKGRVPVSPISFSFPSYICFCVPWHCQVR